MARRCKRRPLPKPPYVKKERKPKPPVIYTYSEEVNEQIKLLDTFKQCDNVIVTNKKETPEEDWLIASFIDFDNTLRRPFITDKGNFKYIKEFINPYSKNDYRPWTEETAPNFITLRENILMSKSYHNGKWGFREYNEINKKVGDFIDFDALFDYYLQESREPCGEKMVEQSNDDNENVNKIINAIDAGKQVDDALNKKSQKGFTNKYKLQIIENLNEIIQQTINKYEKEFILTYDLIDLCFYYNDKKETFNTLANLNGYVSYIKFLMENANYILIETRLGSQVNLTYHCL